MTSAMRRGVAKLTSGDDTSKDQEPDRYRLLVTAGPAYDTSKHSIVPVNGADYVTISNAFITAKVKVRVRGYRGLPTGSPASNAYFDDPVHDRDQYSLAFSFVPKQDIPSVDTVWGNDFDHPVRDRLPPGFNTAFKIVKDFIDPGLSCDAYADEPWLYGPSLSCWFAFRIGDKVQDGADFSAPSDQDVMQDGADGSGQKVRAELGLPENNEKRRKFFLDASNREKLVFEKGRLYQADFYNPYLDFGNLALKLPGFSIKVFKYIDAKSHCLRYVFKNRKTGDMYLNVNFNLLWGEKLEQHLAQEKEDKGRNSEPQLADGHGRNENSSATDLPQAETANQVHTNEEVAQVANHVEKHAQKEVNDQSPVRQLDHETPSVQMAQDKEHGNVTQAERRDQIGHPSPTTDSAAALRKPIWVSADDGSLGNQTTHPNDCDRDTTHREEKADTDVREITQLLQSTATDDKRGEYTDIFD